MRSKIFSLFAYSIAIISAGTGITVLAGIIFPDYIPTQVRMVFGVVLLLLGMYRAVNTWSRDRQRARESRESLLS